MFRKDHTVNTVNGKTQYFNSHVQIAMLQITGICRENGVFKACEDSDVMGILEDPKFETNPGSGSAGLYGIVQLETQGTEACLRRQESH